MDRSEKCLEESEGSRSGRPSPPDSPQTPEMHRNPSPPPEGGDGAAEEPDAIGETVYSKHWLFGALTRLIQMVTEHESRLEELSEEHEDELCKVWDMAMDKDVAGFLQEFKAPDILLGVITKSRSPRLTEICVGILGNMACFHDTRVSLSQNDDLCAVLLLLLADNDPPTLLETCRLLLTCVSQPDVAPLWLERIQQHTDTCNNLCFIMRSSTNVDLLMKVGELVYKLLDEDEELMKNWLSGQPSESDQDLAEALLEAARQLRKENPEALEAYLHALQLLTTVDEGLQHLVSDGGCGAPLWSFVCAVVCEDLCQPDDPPLILQEQKALLAPALLLLSALHTSLQTDISLSLLASLLRVLHFHHENQQGFEDRQTGRAEDGTDESQRDVQIQAVVEMAGDLLSVVLAHLPKDALSDLMKDHHLTDKIWATALQSLLPQYITAVQRFLSTLEEVEAGRASFLKQECSIPSEPNTTKSD